MATRKNAHCPRCAGAVEVCRTVFRSDLKCPHCCADLRVSALYTRVIVIFSLILASVVAWEIARIGPTSCFVGIPWAFYVLWLPVAFLMLTVIVRIAPHMVTPTLVLRRRDEFPTLNLTSGGDEYRRS